MNGIDDFALMNNTFYILTESIDLGFKPFKLLFCQVCQVYTLTMLIS